MNRSTYERYLAMFNARDYEGVLGFYADRFELEFAGYRFTTREQVLKFYRFLHAYLDERITVHAFIGDDQMVAIEATVRLEGKEELTPEALDAAGYGRLVPIKPGQVIEITQYIHYHLQDGRIVRAGCALV